jgi:DNA-binding transcriptional MerR regulator
VQELPKKEFYKVSEVCEHADTQPYVLRFWESEFPQLSPRKTRGGQSVYTRRDVDLVVRIKKLLHDEELSIAEVRKMLDDGGKKTATKVKRAPAAKGKAVKKQEAGRMAELRRRYDDACGEISDLRKQLADANGAGERLDKAHTEIQALRKKLADAEKARDRYRERCGKVADLLEKVAEGIDSI